MATEAGSYWAGLKIAVQEGDADAEESEVSKLTELGMDAAKIAAFVAAVYGIMFPGQVAGLFL